MKRVNFKNSAIVLTISMVMVSCGLGNRPQNSESSETVRVETLANIAENTEAILENNITQPIKPKIAIIYLHNNLVYVWTGNSGYPVDRNPGYMMAKGRIAELISLMTTELVNTNKYRVVERARVKQVIEEQEFQETQMTDVQAAKVGNILGVNKIITGEMSDETMSVRLVDAQSGVIEEAYTSKISHNYQGYDLAKDIIQGLFSTEKENPSDKSEQFSIKPKEEESKIIKLMGYLYVFPEDLGYYSSVPTNVIDNINKLKMYGYSDWRQPTVEELQLICANNEKTKFKADYYMSDIWETAVCFERDYSHGKCYSYQWGSAHIILVRTDNK